MKTDPNSWNLNVKGLNEFWPFGYYQKKKPQQVLKLTNLLPDKRICIRTTKWVTICYQQKYRQISKFHITIKINIQYFKVIT